MVKIKLEDDIGTEAEPLCCLCKSHGEMIHRGCKDHLFGVNGLWNLKQCKTLDCGLIWLDPMPMRSEIGKAYKNYYTHQSLDTVSSKKLDSTIKKIVRRFKIAQGNGYFCLKYKAINQVSILEKIAGLMVYIQPARRAAFDFKAMYIKVQAGAKLLEIGCGSGDQLKFLQRLGWNVEGLDLDPVATEIATSRGLRVYTGSLEKQYFSSQKFDVIVSSHVIEHVHDPVSLLRECRRILNPGGKLIIVTPNTTSLFHKWFGSNWLHLDSPRHLHLFNSASLRRAAEAADLSICKITSTVRDADSVFRASSDIQSSGYHKWGFRHSWLVRSWSKILLLIEWVLLKFGLELGEELMMICEPCSRKDKKSC